MKPKKMLQNSQFLSLAALALTLSVVQSAHSDSFIPTGSMKDARYQHTALLLPNGKVLVAGGIATTYPYRYVDSAELYDPALGAWTQAGVMTTGWEGRSLTLLLNGKVLVIEGALGSAELYDPETDQRAPTGAMIASHSELTATLLSDGRVLIFEGGANGSRAELYDPATGLWSVTGPLNTRRSAPATLLENGKVLVAGGWNNSAGLLSSAELYDPATGAWTATSTLDTPLHGNSAILVQNGKVLIVGGYDGGYVTSARLYDPVAESWTTTGSLRMGRYLHTATLLHDGKVLIAGGYNAAIGGGGGWLTSAELYDPTDGIWATTAQLNARRGYHTATLLPNGKVLIAGGIGDSVLSSAELYSPTETSDGTPPTIVAPPTVFVTTDAGTCEASNVTLGTADVSDDHGVARVINDAPAVFPKGVTTVTWTATDTSGNTATATQTVTVEDRENPLLFCPADIDLPSSLDWLVASVFCAKSSDNCDPEPQVVCIPASGSGFPVGATTVHCSSTDASGNTSSGTFNVRRAALGFTGFLAPVNGADATGGSFAAPLRIFKLGSTVPVKFSATCEGAAVVSGIHRLQVVRHSDQTTWDQPINPEPRDAATEGNQFRLTSDHWQFNLDTKSSGMRKGIWRLIATLSDGSTHDAWIELK